MFLLFLCPAVLSLSLLYSLNCHTTAGLRTRASISALKDEAVARTGIRYRYSHSAFRVRCLPCEEPSQRLREGGGVCERVPRKARRQ